MSYYRTDHPSMVAAADHNSTSPLITATSISAINNASNDNTNNNTQLSPHNSKPNQQHNNTTSNNSSNATNTSTRRFRRCLLGVCAMDKKLKSKPMRQILDRLRGYGEFEILLMGNSLLFDDNTHISQWPIVDCLISFTSSGFPLNKVIDYVKLRRPFCVNDLPSQTVLLQRADVYRQLEYNNIPTPRHLYAIRDEHHNTVVEQTDDYIVVNGERMNLPVVEKPFDGDDHAVYIYYGRRHGGGSRRLFRKVGNRSSRYYPHVTKLRQRGSYIYEELLKNGKDLKVYTIGPGYAHGELRKSPVVDGIVERDLDKKELRLLTKLSEQEKQIAAAICVAFKQNICGFDMIRWRGKSYVIDVNGWSFVKGNMRYYDKCARILRKMCLGCRQGRNALSLPKQLPALWPPIDKAYQPAKPQQNINELQEFNLNSNNANDNTNSSTNANADNQQTNNGAVNNNTQTTTIPQSSIVHRQQQHQQLQQQQRRPFSFLPSIAVGTLAGAYGAISSSLINSITPARLTPSTIYHNNTYYYLLKVYVLRLSS